MKLNIQSHCFRPLLSTRLCAAVSTQGLDLLLSAGGGRRGGGESGGGGGGGE